MSDKDEAIMSIKESYLHKLDSLSILLYTCLLILTVVTVWLFKHRRIRFLHETGLAIIYGLIVGCILRYGLSSDVHSSSSIVTVTPIHEKSVNEFFPKYLVLSQNNSSKAFYKFRSHNLDENVMDRKTTFDPEIFFNVFLPPIIFHAGYSMKKRFFFQNIGSILAFAFLGTTMSIFVIGGLIYALVQFALPHLSFFTFKDTLHFGALISATDPITVLAIFNDIHVDVNLYALVFGESVLNDAVAVVFSVTLEDFGNDFDALLLLKGLGKFLGIFGASLLVGCISGASTSLLTKFTQIKAFHELESSLFILMSYTTFLFAEVLGLTGIVSVLFCGITQAHYTYNNLSEASQSTTKQFFSLLNFMAENFIFSYIGVSMLTYSNHNFDLGFICGSFVAIALGRALNIYLLSSLLNCFRKNKIGWNMQHMLFLSGLRGAIAFALALQNTLTEARQMILTTTLLIVITTVIVNGGFTSSFLKWLNISVSSETEDGYAHLSQSEDCTLTKSWIARMWSDFDSKYMKPLLTHCSPCLLETLPKSCFPIARIFTSQQQFAKHSASYIIEETGNQ